MTTHSSVPRTNICFLSSLVVAGRRHLQTRRHTHRPPDIMFNRAQSTTEGRRQAHYSTSPPRSPLPPSIHTCKTIRRKSPSCPISTDFTTVLTNLRCYLPNSCIPCRRWHTWSSSSRSNTLVVQASQYTAEASPASPLVGLPANVGVGPAS